MDFPWNKPTSYGGYPPFMETSKWTVWTLSPPRWDRRQIWLLQRVAGNGGRHFLGQGVCTFESCGVLWKWISHDITISPCSMVEELQYQTLVSVGLEFWRSVFLRVWNQAWFTISNISSKIITHVWCPPSQNRPPDAQWSPWSKHVQTIPEIIDSHIHFFLFFNYSVSLHQHTLNQFNPYFSVLFHLKQQPSPFWKQVVGLYRSFKRVPLMSSPWRSWRRMSWTRRWVVWSLPSPPERTSGNPAWSWTPTKRPCHLALGVIWVYTYYNIMQHIYIYDIWLNCGMINRYNYVYI